ncbi:hypothetical protein EUZ93_01640 [Wolbachia pipientis]|nr:hypothetical protein [Wolbachia pipientis]
MIAAAALSVTIAVCAMCYPIYLKLENAFNAKAQEPSDQSEHTENPATKMDDVSIPCQFMNKLVGNVL